MTDKNIKIRALLDTQGFDQQVTQLQNKLKEMQKTGEGLTRAQGQLGGQDTMMGRYAKQAFGEFSKESKKDLEAMFASQKREAMHQTISMKAKQQELAKLSKIEDSMTKTQKERVKLLEKELGLIKQRRQETMIQASKTQEQLGRLDPQAVGAGAGEGVPRDGRGAMETFKGLLKSIGAGAIINGAMNAATHMVERERKTLVNKGAAAQIASKELREEFAGQGSRGMFWMPERQKAMADAAKEQRRQGLLDLGKIGGGIAAGAIAGTAIPGIGNVAGAIGGGLLAAGGMMGNEKLRSRVFDQEQYRSLMTKEGMQKYEQNLAAQKAMDPRKAMAQEYFMQNAGKMQQQQRQLGLQTDEGLLGRTARPQGADLANMISNVPMTSPIMGWQRQGRGQGQVQVGQGYAPTGQGPLAPQFGGLQADQTLQNLLAPKTGPVMEGGMPMGRRSEGYMIDQMMGEMGTAQYSQQNIERQRQALLKGGGLTDVQGLAGTAAKFERNVGLMGAGDVMGQLAGAGMGAGAAQTEDATKRILAEAVKVGVDLSKMPVELQRFTAATASIMTAGGGLSETAAARFGAGLGGMTAVEVQAGKGAYQEALGAAKGAGGMEGQIGLGFLMGDEAKALLGKDEQGKQRELSSEMLNSLNQLSVEDLERDEKLLKGTASRLGIEPDKLIELVSKKDATKQSRTAGLEKLQKEYAGMTEEQRETGAGMELYSKLQTRRAQEKGGFMQKSAVAREAAVGMGAAFQMDLGGDRLGAEMGTVEEALKTAPDTAAIAQEKSQATGDVARLRALRDNIDGLKAAAKAHTESAELYNQQFDRFINAVKSGGNAMETMKNQLDGVIEMLAERGFTAASPSD